MKCSKCSYQNPEETRFCQNCGQPLPRVCPGCATHNAPDAKFCTECGAPIIHEDDPQRAVRAALAIQASIGDSVNLAVRLQSAAEPGEVLLSEATARLLG